MNTIFTTTRNLYSTTDLKVTLDFNIIGAGQTNKLMLYVNKQEFHSVNFCNFKKNQEFEIDAIIEELRFGAIEMFI